MPLQKDLSLVEASRKPGLLTACPIPHAAANLRDLQLLQEALHGDGGETPFRADNKMLWMGGRFDNVIRMSECGCGCVAGLAAIAAHTSCVNVCVLQPRRWRLQ